MIRRISIAAAATLLLTAGAAGAAAPSGPRLAVVEYAGGPPRAEVKSVDENGADGMLLAGGGRRTRPLPLFLEAPSWSGDGGTLAFAGEGGKVAGSKDFVLDETQIFLVGADGSGLRPVPGTLEGRRPVLSPDGTRLAFTRVREHKREDRRGVDHVTYQSYSVWLDDLSTGRVTQLTPWRNRLMMVATSFSPDGSTLAVSRRRTARASSEVIAMPLGGGAPRVIARNATEGVFSPDGSRVAFLRLRLRTHVTGGRGKVATAAIEETTDLFVANADGSDPRRLTNTPRGIEVWPSWDPSGRRLAITRLVGGTEAGVLGFGDAVVEMNADGSCPTTVLTAKRAAYYGAVWQPGPGRGAGPIRCSSRSRR
jgi:Tol biopolymer transport system component